MQHLQFALMEQCYNGGERRKFKRVKVSFTLVYCVGVPLSARIAIEGNIAIDALMLDLSQEGMAFLTNSNISIGTVVVLRFTLIDFSVNSDERINNMDIMAKVVSNTKVNAGEYRVSIQFTQINPEDKKAIAEFIRNKEPFT